VHGHNFDGNDNSNSGHWSSISRYVSEAESYEVVIRRIAISTFNL
jgi:hypothetical protein